MITKNILLLIIDQVMIIKIDCREKDLYLKLNNDNGENAKNAKPAIKNKPVNEPKFHIMDLGDGMTIQVPIPQNMNKSKGKPEAGTGDTEQSVSSSTVSNTHTHTVISQRMAIGDIAIMRPAAAAAADNAQALVVLFERKTIYDLAASIKDGRYKEQSFRLTNTAAVHNHNIVYIIEGDLAKYDAKRGGMSVSAIQSAMVSLMYYKGFSVYRTMNLDETAKFIQNFADKLDTEDGKRTPYYSNTCTGTGAGATSDGENLEKEDYCDVAVKKEKRDYITQDNIGVIMLSQIPGVSSKIATAIMKKYNNSMFLLLADMKRKLNRYEDTISPDNASPISSPNAGHIASPKAGIVRNHKLKYLSECFNDINVNDGKCTEDEQQQTKPSRKIGKAIVSKIYHYLCEME